MSVTKDRSVKTGIRRRIRALAVVASCLLACGVLASSVQADQDGSPNFGIPPNADYYNPDYFNQVNTWAANFSSVQTKVAKTKQAVNLKDLKTIVYNKFCLRIDLGYGFNLQTCCPDSFDLSTCPKDNIVDAPFFKEDLENSGLISWTQTRGPAWVVSPAGASTLYGQFPSLRVNMAGFGSIPVTATVHLAQSKGSDGLYSPMDVFYTTQNTLLYEGAPYPGGAGYVSWDDVTLSDGWGAPSPDLGRQGITFALPAHVTGTVDIRISDVRVDGVPLDVGSQCRTATAGQLELKQAGGYYNGNSDPNDRDLNPLGTPGAWRVLGDPGVTTFVPGTVSIPPFSGCRNGAENLDALLTGLVSGAHNDVLAGMHGSIDECANSPDGTPFEGANPAFICPPFPVVEPTAPSARSLAPQTAQHAAKPKAAATGIAPDAKLKAEAPAPRTRTSSKTLKAIAKLTPKQLKNASHQIASLSPNIRKQVMASLPPELVQAMKK